MTAEPSNTVSEVKVMIEATKSELPAANMKLIHSGKVLKDEVTIESCNIKPNAFLVVMISKAKKAAAAPAPTPTPVAAPAPAETPAVSASATPAPATADTSAATPPAANTTTSSESTSASAPAPVTAPAPAETPADTFPPEMVASLTAMGFPEAEAKACLRASQGNPDVAVEYLMNGIPPYAQEIANASNSVPAPAGGSGAPAASSSAEPLAALRNHPQINQLRQLVQSNPSTLQAVLTQVGQQQPELLQEINANQELFLQIMNEPVGTGGSGGSSASPASIPVSSVQSPAANAGAGAGLPANAIMDGINNPAQMAQMIQSMNPEQLQSMAAMMGLSPEQLAGTAQLISRMPQEDFQQYMNMAMQGGGAGLSNLMGGGAGAGAEGAPPGSQVVRLTEEEMAAVDRLADMGFNRTEAAQAYLACDKNEALAANLLMDGGWGDMDMGGGGGAGGSGGNDGDDMYD